MKRIKLLSMGVAATFMLWGCQSGQQEKVTLQNQVDSLQVVVNQQQVAFSALQQITTMLDSINVKQQELSVNLETGTTYEAYVNKLNAIKKDLAAGDDKIDQLEGKLKKSASLNAYFSSTVKKLKQQLSEKETTINNLQQQVEQVKEENNGLITKVAMQEEALNNANDQLELKKQELELVEAKVEEVMKQAQMSEADSYYARGEAMELVAKRTQLAPRKKKDALKDALKYYNKALEMGREDAQLKIDEVKKKL